MFRLFYNIENGLEPISQIFTHHVTALGIASVKQVEDTASAKGADRMTVLFTSVFTLYDKYRVYVSDYFQNHYVFVKALKEAFGVFCNMSVAGCPMADLFANFCTSILDGLIIQPTQLQVEFLRGQAAMASVNKVSFSIEI